MEKIRTIPTNLSGRKPNEEKNMEDYMPLYECSRWMSGIPCEEMKRHLMKDGFQIVEYNGEEWVKTKDFNLWIDIHCGMVGAITESK